MRSLLMRIAAAFKCRCDSAFGSTRGGDTDALFDCVFNEISVNFSPLRSKFMSISVLKSRVRCAASADVTVILSVEPEADMATTKRFRRSGTASINTPN